MEEGIQCVFCLYFLRYIQQVLCHPEKMDQPLDAESGAGRLSNVLVG